MPDKIKLQGAAVGNEAFNAAQAFLLQNRYDYDQACSSFSWPELDEFNWAIDWFDDVLASGPLKDNVALRIVGEAAEAVSFHELAERSNRVANGLAQLGVKRGDRILLMLGNVVPLWETMLAAMKLGVVVVPSTLLLTKQDIAERMSRAGITCVIVSDKEVEKFEGVNRQLTRIVVGQAPAGWTAYHSLHETSASFHPKHVSHADDPILLYFTSGTTSRPKMVLHSQTTFPVGHLATMYWCGMGPGDVHMAIGAPGWAGHTFTAVFAPWNAGASVLMMNQPRFNAREILDILVEHRVDSLFAPPTVWRYLLQEDLASWKVTLKTASAAGEPLNPEVIERVRAAWQLDVKDGWGQSEATVQIANTFAQPLNVGALGWPLPGCSVAVLDENDHEADEGELALPMQPRPAGLMLGYLQEDGSIQKVTGAFYRSGDAVRRNADGTLTYVGRVDDVFKSSDYRISPFELESILIEHPAVIEAAVIPAPDELRLSVPKAVVTLAAGHAPSEETAKSIFQHSRTRLAPYKRIRRLSFAELPKTVSGKIRRVQLRQAEAVRTERAADEFREDDSTW